MEYHKKQTDLDMGGNMPIGGVRHGVIGLLISDTASSRVGMLVVFCALARSFLPETMGAQLASVPKLAMVRDENAREIMRLKSLGAIVGELWQFALETKGGVPVKYCVDSKMSPQDNSIVIVKKVGESDWLTAMGHLNELAGTLRLVLGSVVKEASVSSYTIENKPRGFDEPELAVFNTHVLSLASSLQHGECSTRAAQPMRKRVSSKARVDFRDRA